MQGHPPAPSGPPGASPAHPPSQPLSGAAAAAQGESGEASSQDWLASVQSLLGELASLPSSSASVASTTQGAPLERLIQRARELQQQLPTSTSTTLPPASPRPVSPTASPSPSPRPACTTSPVPLPQSEAEVMRPPSHASSPSPVHFLRSPRVSLTGGGSGGAGGGGAGTLLPAPVEVMPLVPAPMPQVDLAMMFANPLVMRVEGSGQLTHIDTLSHAREQRLLIDSLREARRRIRVRLYTGTTDQFRVLLSNGCKILHFSGHGSLDSTGGAHLMFEDDDSCAHPVDIPTLSALLLQQPDQAQEHQPHGRLAVPRLVFVGACTSIEIGQLFIRAGAEFVVCVGAEDRVLDQAAISFSRAFYHALFAGRSVEAAFLIGQARVVAESKLRERRQSLSESRKYVLLTRQYPNGVPPTEATQLAKLAPPFFRESGDSADEDSEAGTWMDLTPKPCFRALPAKAPVFVGRSSDMHRLLQLVRTQRLVTVRGPPGLGKTSLVKAVAHWVVTRPLFRDGVLYCSLRDCESRAQIFAALARAIDESFRRWQKSRTIKKKRRSKRKQRRMRNRRRKSSAKRGKGKKAKRKVEDEAEDEDEEDGEDEVEIEDAAERFAEAMASVHVDTERAVLDALHGAEVLLVCDNCEDAIYADHEQFQDVVNRFLATWPQSTILLASREAVGGGVDDVAEKVYTLRPLGRLDAARLFFQRSPRSIKLSELGITDHAQALPTLANHPVLRFLGGHPQAIALAAPLLQDRSLAEVQHLLSTEALDALDLNSARRKSQDDDTQGERSSVNTLAASLQVSLDQVRLHCPGVQDFFAIMALVPAGAMPSDLHSIWGRDWKHFALLLTRASLVQRSEFRVQGRVINKFYTIPFVTSFAERALYASPAMCARTVAAGRLHFGRLVEDIWAALEGGGGEARAAHARTLLVINEANFWACLKPRPNVDGAAAPHDVSHDDALSDAAVGLALAELLGPKKLHALMMNSRHHEAGSGEDTSSAVNDTAAVSGGHAPLSGRPQRITLLGRLATAFASSLFLVDRPKDCLRAALFALDTVHRRQDMVSQSNLLKVVATVLLSRPNTAVELLTQAESDAPERLQLRSRSRSGSALLSSPQQLMQNARHLEFAQQCLSAAKLGYKTMRSQLGHGIALSALGYAYFKMHNFTAAKQRFTNAVDKLKRTKHHAALHHCYACLTLVCQRMQDHSSASDVLKFSAAAQREKRFVARHFVQLPIDTAVLYLHVPLPLPEPVQQVSEASRKLAQVRDEAPKPPTQPVPPLDLAASGVGSGRPTPLSREYSTSDLNFHRLESPSNSGQSSLASSCSSSSSATPRNQLAFSPSPSLERRKSVSVSFEPLPQVPKRKPKPKPKPKVKVARPKTKGSPPRKKSAAAAAGVKKRPKVLTFATLADAVTAGAELHLAAGSVKIDPKSGRSWKSAPASPASRRRDDDDDEQGEDGDEGDEEDEEGEGGDGRLTSRSAGDALCT